MTTYDGVSFASSFVSIEQHHARGRSKVIASSTAPPQTDRRAHHMHRKNIDGVTHLVTRISHGSKEINDHLCKLMGNQLCLQLKEFWDLVDCPLDEAGERLVRERCADGRNPFLCRG